METYIVKVYNDRTEWKNESGELHRVGGPAVEFTDGYKFWYLNGIQLSEEKFNKRTNSQDSCDGKIVEVDGKKYSLKLL